MDPPSTSTADRTWCEWGAACPSRGTIPCNFGQVILDKNVPFFQQELIQILGNEVSYLELSRMTGIDKETVERYIILLERAFIVFRLGSFSRNLRKELSKSRKIYFYDNGIRNAVIRNYAPLELRTDTGALWENFLISERLKFLQKNEWFSNRYFWRTHDRQEIDYIEERDGILHAFEFKWSEKTKSKFPNVFLRTYPEHKTDVINRSSFEMFVM